MATLFRGRDSCTFPEGCLRLRRSRLSFFLFAGNTARVAGIVH
jgi:hypothetical protein